MPQRGRQSRPALLAPYRGARGEDAGCARHCYRFSRYDRHVAVCRARYPAGFPATQVMLWIEAEGDKGKGRARPRRQWCRRGTPRPKCLPKRPSMLTSFGAIPPQLGACRLPPPRQRHREQRRQGRSRPLASAPRQDHPSVISERSWNAGDCPPRRGADPHLVQATRAGREREPPGVLVRPMRGRNAAALPQLDDSRFNQVVGAFKMPSGGIGGTPG
jgi:hypothetical protein